MNNNQKNSFYNDPSISLVKAGSWDDAKNVQSIIKSSLNKVLGNGEIDIEIERPQSGTFGDYSTNIAMILSKNREQSPMDLATEIVEKLKKDDNLKDIVDEISIAKPGFINFKLSQLVLFQEINKVLTIRNDYSQENILKGKRIMFEYAHPNPFKAFHIGHLRNIILGESLIRILEKMGAEVIRVNYQGDVGMHIAKCLWSFKKIQEKDFPTDTTERVALLAKCYAEGASAFNDEVHQNEIKEINKLIYTKEDQLTNKLWETGKKWSLDKFHQIYKRVDSTFVREYFESETLTLCKKFIDLALEKGILEKSQGAVIFNGEKYGLETRVFLNGQGLPTYEGKELGLASLQFNDFGDIDLCIHNVAVEQISFFKTTFKVESLLDPEKFQGKQYHNAYEFVGLKSGKMSSRTGNVVLGEDILNQAVTMIKEIIKTKSSLPEKAIDETAESVGVGAVKYAFLNISPKSYLAFDIDKSVNFDGNSGPYLQYTYARSLKIVKDSTGYRMLKPEQFKKLEFNNEEVQLMHKIFEFNEVVIEAGKHLSPNYITTYLFELSQIFNQFYKQRPILKADEPIRSFRIMLADSTSEILEIGLNLLGINTIAQM